MNLSDELRAKKNAKSAASVRARAEADAAFKTLESELDRYVPEVAAALKSAKAKKTYEVNILKRGWRCHRFEFGQHMTAIVVIWPSGRWSWAWSTGSSTMSSREARTKFSGAYQQDVRAALHDWAKHQV